MNSRSGRKLIVPIKYGIDSEINQKGDSEFFFKNICKLTDQLSSCKEYEQKMNKIIELFNLLLENVNILNKEIFSEHRMLVRNLGNKIIAHERPNEEIRRKILLVICRLI